MKQESSTTTGINPIEMELMLSPLKGQLDDLESKLNALIGLTLTWNETLERINESLSDGIDAIRETVHTDDSDNTINIEELLKRELYKSNEDDNVLRLNPAMFRGEERNDDGN